MAKQAAVALIVSSLQGEVVSYLHALRQDRSYAALSQPA